MVNKMSIYEKTFTRPNGKKINGTQVIAIVSKYIMSEPDASYELTIGTDSQSFADCTKIVEVIALHRTGRGGIYFYNIERIPKVQSLRQKIYEETTRSLNIADGLLVDVEVILEENGINIDEDIDIKFQIHCDIGNNGKTNELIKEITGWVTSYGYECLIKPDSWTANSIADKYSK